MTTQKLGTILRNTVEKAHQRLQYELEETKSSQIPAPGKWSPKQIIGHLIDSASNNHQRFVRANFKNDLCFAGYRQEEWVDLQDYQHMDWQELLTLWRSFNLLIARVMDQTPEELLMAERQKHDLDKIAFYRVAAGEAATLAYFMKDYIIHLEHHIVQVLPNYEVLLSKP